MFRTQFANFKRQSQVTLLTDICGKTQEFSKLPTAALIIVIQIAY